MRLEPFPRCCSAYALVALDDLHEGRKQELRELVTTISDMKLLVATTVARQVEAEKALKKFGFKRSRSTFSNAKHWHTNDRVILWYVSVPELLEKLK